MTPAIGAAPADPRLAARATGLLLAFNTAGILSAADVQVASRLGALAGERDEAVLLAAALVVRSTRHGSVVLDLSTAEQTTSPGEEDDEDVPGAAPAGLAWPDDWPGRCAASPLTGPDGPLHLDGDRLWLARYWEQEQQVAAELVARCATPPDDIDPVRLAAGLRRLFPLADDADQQQAAAGCALARVSVLAGGPGTGKTTTVSRLLAVLREQHPAWRIALAAPTGKAAARLEEAVRSSTARLDPADAALLGDLPATTLHRLLGWKPGPRTRFRHDRTNRLPLDVVVVDESSMLSLTLMCRLLEALRPAARLILVGDPDQLASVEAGAVLGDLVERAVPGRRTAGFAARLAVAVPGADAPADQPDSPAARVRDGVSRLSLNRRFGGDTPIADLARAIRDGDDAAALKVLATADGQVQFVPVEETRIAEERLAGIRAEVAAAGAEVLAAATAGDAAGALTGLERHRLLCAHRNGPRGAKRWGERAAAWLAEGRPDEAAERADGRLLGEPLLVTANDHEAKLYNGDTGVVIRDPGGGLCAVFGRGGDPIRIPLGRLGAVRPLYAMTVHRSQGSQFEHVTLVLPDADSPLGTRQTLYTAVTRAKHQVRIIGSEESFVAAVRRLAARATGLADHLEQIGP